MAMGRRWSDSGYDDPGTSAHVSPALVGPLKNLVGTGSLFQQSQRLSVKMLKPETPMNTGMRRG